jgi:hypothetical protein
MRRIIITIEQYPLLNTRSAGRMFGNVMDPHAELPPGAPGRSLTNSRK